MATVMDRKTTFVVLLVHCYLSLATLTCMLAYAGGNPNVLCRKGERDALFTLKKGIIDPSNLLSSWIGQECCTWKGIACDNITGHVVRLNLRNPYHPYEDIYNHFPSFFGCLRNLRYLNLSEAGFMGTIPHQLANLSNLHTLDIRQRFYYMPLQVDNLEWLSHLSLLEFLDMSYVNLSKASNWLQVMNMLPSLSELHLFHCGLDKYDPIPHVNFSSLTIKVPLLGVAVQNMSSLRNLLLSGNNFSYTIPKWLYNMTTLERLYLPGNNIQGVLPKAIGRLSQLILLDLSQNELEGKIPRFLGNLCNMQHLDLSENNLGGGTLPDQLREHKKLSVLSLGGNKLSGPIPNDRRRGDLLLSLDLSKNLLSGEFPDCWMNYSQLRVLNLGSNHLTGNIPSSIGSLTALLVLSLDKNNLSGDLPVSLQNCKYLMIVDFSENHLSGSLSNWLGNSSVDLSALVLRSNKFHGSIPQEICHFNFLQIVDLASNKLSGPIPRCFGNLSAMAEQSPTRTTIASGWEEPVFLVTKGKEYEYGEMLSLVTSMDLSSNNLIGEIPEELTGLYGVRFLNLSNNQLYGKIPENISAMKFLESLDISMNQLTGVIPQSMGTLTFLSYLNLSHNNFSGRIPSGTQLQSFGALSFIGNHDLCGPPLTPSCSGDDTPLEPIPNVDDEGGGDGDWIDMKWFCISVPLGFVVGFWGVVGPLAFNKAWRYAFFKYLDDIKYKLFGGV
ncbi:receptor-like protein EIX1 [Alnus glutinosa]|uniref:receptor-like protein EIX1 n=1 Tax=Alnus glutinosa TaxID=3517 RepID=UPI002D78D0AE|nr:receptor-like protein EIX1 [Alnus glutinosa]